MNKNTYDTERKMLKNKENVAQVISDSTKILKKIKVKNKN